MKHLLLPRNAEQAEDSFLLSDLTPTQVLRWEACKTHHNFLGFQKKQLVSYTLLFGKPSIRCVLTCTSLDVTLKDGLESTWEHEDGKVLHVGYRPVEVSPGCFLYHPRESLVTFLEYNQKFNARFALSCKTPYPPRDYREGVHYLAERAIFTKNFQG